MKRDLFLTRNPTLRKFRESRSKENSKPKFENINTKSKFRKSELEARSKIEYPTRNPTDIFSQPGPSLI
uniref:Candidate secreted effector n=1 Tax=Meloidogyne incognita TaxID=6306 RepID=A0A914M6Z9_MELIC